MNSNSYSSSNNFNSSYDKQQLCNMQDNMPLENINGDNLVNSNDNIPKVKNEEEDDYDEEMDDEDEEEEEDDEDEEEEEILASGYDGNIQNGGDMEELEAVNDNLENDEKILVPKSELAAIKANLQMLNHQVFLLIIF
jgi:hypothetical protein